MLMDCLEIFDLDIADTDYTQAERNLFAAVLNLALRDALVMSVSEEACEAREWWTSGVYDRDIATFCEILGINHKRMISRVKEIIREHLLKDFITLEEQRILKIEKEEGKVRYYKRSKPSNKEDLVKKTIKEIERLKKLPKNGYGLGAGLRNDDVRIGLMSKIGSKCPNTPEGILSHKIAVLLKNKTLDGDPIVWFHVPNEAGKSGVRYGMALNSMGRIAGAPDYVITTPKGTLFMEVKAENGNLSEKQKAFKAWCDIVGTRYIEVKDVETVEDLVNEYI